MEAPIGTSIFTESTPVPQRGFSRICVFPEWNPDAEGSVVETSAKKLAAGGEKVSGFETELVDAVADLIAIDPKQLSRLRLVSIGALERLHQ